MNFLADRTPRERYLILIALSLLAFVAGWMLIIRPMSQAHSSAVQDQSRTVRDFDLVQSGLPFLSQSRPDLQPFDRNALIATAREVNISISRVQPENDGDLKVWFEDSTAGEVYAFLNQLTATYNAAIELVQMNRRPGGQISAQITLRPLT